MTRGELAAFNEGVKAALGAASTAADAIEKRPGFRHGREGFGSEALKSFAEAGAELLLLPANVSAARKDSPAERAT
jgi:hypothetical protein